MEISFTLDRDEGIDPNDPLGNIVIRNATLREEQPALLVNWFEVTVIREADAKQLYHNAFVTRHALNDSLMPEISVSGTFDF